MGIIFFILFTLAEIALVVLTFTKFREKASWRKNRAIIRAAEVVLLLGMVLVPTVNLKWRFFGALIVLAVRLFIAGIVWLVMRNKSNGQRKKPVTVISCVLSVILIGFSLVPAFIFTNYNGLPTTGEYKVSETSAILVDKNRVDEFENDGSYREVPAHFYYPDTAEGNFPLHVMIGVVAVEDLDDQLVVIAVHISLGAPAKQLAALDRDLLIFSEPGLL